MSRIFGKSFCWKMKYIILAKCNISDGMFPYIVADALTFAIVLISHKELSPFYRAIKKILFNLVRKLEMGHTLVLLVLLVFIILKHNQKML